MRLSRILPVFLADQYTVLSELITELKKTKDGKVSFLDKLWLWYHGFSSGYKNYYGLTRENIHLYLDPVRYHRIHPLNGSYSRLIDNKSFLPLFCPYTADLYLVFEKGLLRYSKGLRNGELFKDLKDYVASASCKLICKPLHSSGGSGVRSLDSDNAETVIKDLISRKSSFIINNWVEQGAYSKKIFDGSVNTLRLMMYRDVDTRKIIFSGALHRFGTRESQPVDNTSKGGIMAIIDLETGVMDKAVGDPGTVNYGWHTVHPDTKEAIEGVMIPDWKSKLKIIHNYFETLFWLEYAGADIVLTDNGFIILEINSLPGIEQPQLGRPYLKDGEIRKLFISKGLKIRSYLSY